MGAAGAASLVIAALALLWLGLAAALAIVAARRFRIAQQVLDAARVNSRLLGAAPARPLVVHPDGHIEADGRLVRGLSLDRPPASLEELGGEGRGLEATDLERLRSALETARASAGSVSCRVRTSGSGRTFDVRGGSAPGEAPGTFLLWFVDVSAAEEEMAKLSLRLRQTEAAVELVDPGH